MSLSTTVEPSSSHVVQFYEDASFLATRVARFLEDGLVAGDAVVIIATPEHQSAFCQKLTAKGHDLDRARTSGQLVLLDARATLARFMIDDTPDWRRFQAVIGSLLEGMAGDGRAIRAYGEMVDLLWNEGNRSGAIHLEEMWNELGRLYDFSLLCAYAFGNFYREADSEDFLRVCHAHSHVLPTEAFVDLDSEESRLRDVTFLQQRAKALAQEVSHRKDLERALRDALAERSRFEAVIREREEELRDFVENAAEGLHWVDANGIIVWANQAELDLLGYSSDEYVGKDIASFYVDKDVIDDILARLASRETLKNFGARLRHRDGSIRHVVLNSNVYWRDGEFVHTRCFTRDVTALKEAEAQREQLASEREHLLERERSAREQAESANQAKDEFLAMLGHELRNPLAPIMTAVQLARLRGQGTREIDVIDRQVGHLMHLVDDLLDVSRITRGKIDLRLEAIEMRRVVGDAIESVTPLLEQRRQVVVVDIPKNPCQVHGDPARLRQVVANLLTNAAKYSDSGTRITVAVTTHDGRVILRVRDQGMGIESKMLDRIFDTFVQQRQGKDRASGGLGLGLAIVRSLVHLHGGRVAARSDGPGKGSEFEVDLPALDPADRLARPPSAFALSPAAVCELGERVLVVDDNEDAALLLAEGLHALGYTVRAAHDGPSAIRLAREFKPTVGVLDIGLPIMDGYELAQRLRDEPWANGLKLVAVSGYGQDADKLRSRAAGFVDHAVKPIDISLLDAILRTGRND